MALEDTATVVYEPLLSIWNEVVQAVPGIIAAILILVLGYLVGALIGYLVKKVLDKTNLISLTVKKLDLQQEVGKWDISGLLGLIIKWGIFVVFLTPAAEVVSLEALAVFFSTVALWIPNIIIAVVIVLAGIVFAEYLAKKIKEVRSKKSSLLADIVKVVTLVYVALIAFKQVGIQVSFAENSFLIILAGIMLAVAIAFGLAFKDEAKKLAKDIRKKI
jgi:hypothetical protein